MSTTTAASIITAASFPTPDRVLVTNDPDQHRSAADFAELQAEAANAAVQKLRRRIRCDGANSATTQTVFNDLSEWRSRLRRDPHRGTVSSRRHRAECRHWMGDAPLLFPLGAIGRLREGSEWSPHRRVFVGGAPTPASRALEYYGAVALARFDDEAPDTDILQHDVRLAPSRCSPEGGVTKGRRLMRGAAAEHAAAALAKVLATNGTTLRFEAAPLYSVTPPLVGPASRMAGVPLWFAAERELTELIARGDTCSPQEVRAALARAAYYMWQEPVRVRGQDDSNRVFLVAVGSMVLPEPPVLPRNIDLMAYTLGQGRFQAEVEAALAAG